MLKVSLNIPVYQTFKFKCSGVTNEHIFRTPEVRESIVASTWWTEEPNNQVWVSVIVL